MRRDGEVAVQNRRGIAGERLHLSAPADPMKGGAGLTIRGNHPSHRCVTLVAAIKNTRAVQFTAMQTEESRCSPHGGERASSHWQQ